MLSFLRIVGGLVLLGLAHVVGSFVYQIVYYRFFHPLAKFPGPFWGSVTRLWITYHNVKGDEPETFQALHRRYGPVIRITPVMLLVSDATKLPVIYSRQANKSKHYITGSFGKTESLFNMQDSRTHARFRKVAAAPYSLSNIKKMEPLIDARIAEWVDRLDELFARRAGPAASFDFAPWAVYMAYDVISEVGFGEPFGFIRQGRDVGGLIQGFHDGLTPFGIMARLYPMTNWVKGTFLGRFFVATPEQDSGIGTLMRFRDKLIDQRFKDIEAGTNVRFDLLQTFIEARDEDGKPLDLDYIKAEILLVLLAGADTTGTAFQAMVAHVLSHPAAHARLVAELDAATASGAIGPAAAIPRYDDIVAHCPYYVACLRESMRLTPSAPNIFPRVAGPGGVVLGVGGVGEGTPALAPEGTELTCNPWLVHRDRALYGDDAAEFRPERWLEDPERAREFLRYNMAFGYGARVCLGREIANMELYKAPLQFFRTFRPEIGNREAPGRYVIKGGVSYYEDMWLSISRRVPAKA